MSAVITSVIQIGITASAIIVGLRVSFFVGERFQHWRAARPAEPEPLTVSAGLSDLRVRAVGTVMHDEITWNVCQVFGFTLRETYGMVWGFDGQTVRAFIFTDPASDGWRPSEAETLDTAKHFLSAGGAE